MPAPASTTQTTPRTAADSPPIDGWHVGHYFYRFRPTTSSQRTSMQWQKNCDAFVHALDGTASDAPVRLQTYIVSGHKADFAVLAMDSDPMVVDRVHQRLVQGEFGAVIEPRYSFVSLTEVSEYVPTLEQYAGRLEADGHDKNSEMFQSRLRAYAARLPEMVRQRVTPDLPGTPDWSAWCFYPMNKKREVDENWFLLPFEARSNLMTEHARSGMAFAGKVSQLITVAVGLDDWEWGVTLWATKAQYLKDIVYRMRFDEASARYAEFGSFYSGYVATPAQILDHCGLSQEGTGQERCQRRS